MGQQSPAGVHLLEDEVLDAASKMGLNFNAWTYAAGHTRRFR